MPKVKVIPNPLYNPIGIRLLLGEIGVSGPMLQDDSGITCMMSEDQINRFRHSRGAAHRIDVVPDPPPPPPAPEAEPIKLELVPHPEMKFDEEPRHSDDEPEGDDPSTAA